jgi:uncharacterized protein YwqG
MINAAIIVACLLVIYFLSWRHFSQKSTTSDVDKSDDAVSATALVTLEKLKEAVTKLEVQGLSGMVNPDADVVLNGSRLGGPLLWPVGQLPPKDDAGKRMILLAQIDLATLPQRLDLPDVGLLQFLIGTDDLMGADGFPSSNGTGCVIVIHPASIKLEEHAAPSEEDAEYSPFQNREIERIGRAIDWTLINCPPPVGDYRIEQIMNNRPKMSDADDNMLYDFLDQLAGKRGIFDILLRGNPDFTQYDIRSAKQMPDYINLAGFSSSGGAFMWGDLGEACFLIAASDLAQGDVKDVRYSWDCS